MRAARMKRNETKRNWRKTKCLVRELIDRQVFSALCVYVFRAGVYLESVEEGGNETVGKERGRGNRNWINGRIEERPRLSKLRKMREEQA